MFEFLSSIPSNALTAIVTALLTSGITLMGISVTNKQTLSRLKIQHEHELKIRDKEIMRERAEELYVNAKSHTRFMFISNMPYYKVMTGKITYEQAINMVNKSDNSGYDLSRMHMISDVYFPDIAKELTELIEFNGEIYKIHQKFLVGYKKGKIQDLEMAVQYLNANELLTAKISTFENNIASKCRNV